MIEKRHQCRRSRTCCCSSQALEPDDECPIHGAGEWPPRCCVCGRFMKWSEPEIPTTSMITISGFQLKIVNIPKFVAWWVN